MYRVHRKKCDRVLYVREAGAKFSTLDQNQSDYVGQYHLQATPRSILDRVRWTTLVSTRVTEWTSRTLLELGDGIYERFLVNGKQCIDLISITTLCGFVVTVALYVS